MKKLIFLSFSIVVINLCHVSAQSNVIQTTGDVGIGTLTPSAKLDVNGTMIVDSMATFKDSLRVQKKLIVDQDVKIQGKSVFIDNGKFKKDLKVLGIARMKDKLVIDGLTKMNGDAKVFGDFKIKSLENQTISYNRLVTITPNGKINASVLRVPSPLPSICSTILPWTSPLGNNTNPNDVVLCPTTSNVGIGTHTPQAKFDVNGSTILNGQVAIGTTINDPIYGFHPSNGIYQTIIKKSLLITGSNGIIGFSSDNTPNYHGDNAVCLEVRPNGHPQFPSSTDPFRGLNFFRPSATGQDRSNGNFDLFISSQNGSEGFVGFGTPYPKSRLNISANASELVFAVTKASSDKDVFRIMGDGHVWCTELDIKLKEDFPDYVFTTSYALMPLDELEEYIYLNKHLPNIPSAEEVAKEGINVGEMQVKQMEKIEELTLYLLQIKTELDLIKKENSELKKLILEQ